MLRILISGLVALLAIGHGAESVADPAGGEGEPRTLLLSGDMAEVSGPPLQVRRGCLNYWQDVDTAATWKVSVSAPCVVSVEIAAAVAEPYAGSTYEIRIGDQILSGTMPATDGWEDYRNSPLGSLQLEPGDYTVRLQPTAMLNSSFGNIKAVYLTGDHIAYEAASAALDLSGPVKVFTTARHRGAGLGQQDSLQRKSEVSADATTIVVDPNRRFQRIEGFGGAFTESAGIVYSRLSPKLQQEVLHAYFDAGAGHGYRLCRTHINSCDFSVGNYAYAEVEGDVNLEHFSIEHDRQFLIPLIHAAQKAAGQESIKLLASPWSPPAWMKTNGRMTGGGKLKPEYRDAWARYYCRYIEEYAAENIDIWGLTVQNEPAAVQRWESCIYTAEEERDFVRDHLGPALQDSGLERIRLVVWDHNRDLLFDRAKTVFDDPDAAKYVWGAGFHWYVSDDYHHVQMVHDFYPDKKLLFTEGCLEGGPHISDWSGGERYARSIIHDLNCGAVGWIDWNLLLDTEGGPNHVGNYCSAPILADVNRDCLIYNSSYYYLGHFARFIRPGAQRLLSGNTGTQIISTAFRNVDGTIVIVILNDQEFPVRYALKMGDLRTEAVSHEHSITTLVVNEPVSTAN